MTNENNKTIIIPIIVAVIAVLLIGVYAFIEIKKSGIISTSESKEILKEFNKNFNSEDRKVIYYASSECGYCELQEPVLETIANDYEIEYYSIDSSKLSLKERREILNQLGIEHATPTTVVVENGEVIDVLEGYTEGKDLIEFFKDTEILEEDATYSAEKNINYINYSDYENLISNSSSNIIVIGQTTCSHCIAIKPALNTVAQNYNLVINYLNLTDINDEETDSFFETLKTIEYNDEDFLKDGSFGTPLTLIVENGKVKHYISGERTISQLTKEFKKAGLIK